MTARFLSTSCSQCGKDLGPGDAGVSRCADHRSDAGVVAARPTPGPWEVDATGYRAPGNGLCVMAWPECIAVVGAGNPDQPQLANARLIAAAPELLEALEAFMALDRTFSTICDAHLEDEAKQSPMGRAVKLARTAIAKATGSAA